MSWWPLTQIQTIIVAGLLAIVLTAGGIAYIYNKGENAGGDHVTTAVQQKTIKTLDDARISKEKTDEEVHRTPFNDRVDGLR